MLGSLWAIYACWFGGAEGGALLGLIPVGMLLAVGQASQQRVAYRAWKREWEALAGPSAPRVGWPIVCTGIVLGIALLWGGVAAAQAGPSAIGHTLGWLLLLSPPLLAAWALRRCLRRRRNRTARALPVKVVANAVLPVPTHAALPEHCKALLAATGP